MDYIWIKNKLCKPVILFQTMDWSQLLNSAFWWAIFGISHSVLASHKLKSKLPLKGQAFRILYNILATVILLLVLTHQPSIMGLLKDGFALKGLHLMLFLLIFLIGLIVGALGLIAWNIPAFLGLEPEQLKLDVKGIYAFCRHPVYTSALILFSSVLVLGISANTLSWLLGAGGYFVIGTIFEEKNLNAYFEEYSSYRSNVGRFFPWRMSHVNYLVQNYR